MIYYEKLHKKTEWKKRGLGIGLRYEFFEPFLKVLRVVIIIAVLTPIVVGKIKFEYQQWQYKQTVVKADKINRSRYKQELEQKLREEREYQDWLKERQKKENKIDYNKNVCESTWNLYKKQYPKGTYVLNKKTMEKGKVIDYQGERIFTDMNWYFDIGVDDIEIIGYKEYKKYVKLYSKP